MNDELVAAVKDVIADDRKTPAAHDLLHSEVRRVVEVVRGEEFPTTDAFSNEELAKRVEAFERLTSPIVQAGAWGGMYGAPPTRSLWPRLVSQAAGDEIPINNANGWHLLQKYPAVLLLYGIGIGCLAADRPDFLAALLSHRGIPERKVLHPVATQLFADAAFINEIANRLPGYERHHAPASERIHGWLRPVLAPGLIPSETEFDYLFDRFEYLLALVRFDLTRGDSERGIPTRGRFMWRTVDGQRVNGDLRLDIQEQGERWPLLRAGLFQGSVERVNAAVAGVDQLVRRW